MRAARQSPFFAAKVRGKRREGFAMQHAIAHQDEARIVRNLAPFVKIERERIRALDSAKPGSKIGREYRQRSVRSIDMEPEMLAARKIGQRAEIVDGAGIHASRRADQQERRKSGAPVRLDRLFEFRQVHPLARSGRNQTERITADPADIHGPRNAGVNGRRCVRGQPPGTRGDTRAPHFETQGHVAGDQRTDEIRHRSAGHEQTRGGLGKAKDGLHPADDLALHFDRDVIAAAQVRVETGGQHLGHDANGRSPAMHPAHESGVHIAGRVRQDVVHESAVNLRQIGGRVGHRIAKVSPNLSRDGLPDGTLANVLDIVQSIVEHLVSLHSECGPVVGIEIGRHIFLCSRRIPASEMRHYLQCTEYFGNILTGSSPARCLARCLAAPRTLPRKPRTPSVRK